MASFLITGASRGLGLALVKELVSLPSTKVSKIIAAARGEAPLLKPLLRQHSDRIALVKLDVTDEHSIEAAVEQTKKLLHGRGLDVLINNAGICQYAFDGIAAMNTLRESFEVNVMGVHHVTQAFLPLLKIGGMKKVVNISTTLGSMSLAHQSAAFPAPAYKISKAALNALTVQYALEYEKEGFVFMALCPGWLKTDLGGKDMADLTPEQGAKASLDIIFNKGQEVNGKMPKVYVEGWENAEGPNVYDGSNAPW